LISLIIFILVINNQAYAEELSQDIINTDYYISYDLAQEQILYSKNTNNIIYPASITKLMTAIVLLDKYKINQTINTQYPKDYIHTGKVAYIEENVQISVQNLLDLLLVYSANDAAYIAALAVEDNVDDFIFLMNQKSKSIGMQNTNFMNPDGLDDENHYTTLNDLLIMTKYIVQNKEIISTVSKSKFISNASGKEKTYDNTNLLLNEGFTGIKTGWTDKAGLTFIAYNQLNNREIITIVNKSIVDEKKYNHFSDTKILYKTSIEDFDTYTIVDKDKYVYQVRNSIELLLFKAGEDWNSFINKNTEDKIYLSKFNNNTFYLKYGDEELSYKIKQESFSIKWRFDPFKIFKINANQ